MIELIKTNIGAYLGYVGDYVFETLKSGKIHDKIILDYIINNVKNDYTCIDVGAYIGSITVPLSKLCKKVYCFEPQKNIFLCLCGNLFINECYNVFPFNKLVFSKDMKFSQIIENTDGNFASTSFKPDENGNEFGIRIDSIIDEKIDFIKCDVEGGDLDALIGCEKLIDKFKPKIIFEFHKEISPSLYGRNFDDYINFLSSKNYIINQMDEGNFLAI